MFDHLKRKDIRYFILFILLFILRVDQWLKRSINATKVFPLNILLLAVIGKGMQFFLLALALKSVLQFQ